MYVEILHENNLTVQQWQDSIFKEYIRQVWWSHFFGTTEDDIIQLVEDLMKKKGDLVHIGLRGRLQGGHVTGNKRGKENAGKVDFFEFPIQVDLVRDLVERKNISMSDQRVMWNVMQECKNALIEEAKVRLEDDITAALTDVTTGRVQGRYLYGDADANWNATHATALNNITATMTLSLNIIDIAKRKAKIPVNAIAPIRPMKVVSGERLEEWWMFVAHDFALRDLMNNDASWKNEKLNLPPLPDENNSSVLFTGSSFKGASKGVLIYEYERMPLAKNGNGLQYTQALLLGAQACGVAYAERSKFAEQFDDLGHEVVYETADIRGIKKMVFNRATPENQGEVQVFVPAAVDA